MVAIFGGLGMFMFDNPFAEAQELNEIQKNLDVGDAPSFDDKVGKIIRVQIHDGMTSSDSIR